MILHHDCLGPKYCGGSLAAFALSAFSIIECAMEVCASVRRLAPIWLSVGYSVVLLTGEEATEEDYAMPSDVYRVTLPDLRQVGEDFVRERCLAIQDAVKRLSIDVFVHNCATDFRLIYELLTVKALGIPFVISNHGSFSHSLVEWTDTSFKYMSVFALADRMCVLSTSEKYFWDLFDVEAAYIPNPLSFDFEGIDVSELDFNNLIWVGRLSIEKNHLDAVDIFNEVVKSVPSAKLSIVGSGEDLTPMKALSERIERLGLTNSVTLCGYIQNVEQFYRKASAMLVTSSTESFSMTLFESKAYGIPSVVYDLPNLELLRNRQGVIVVRQGDKIAAARSLIRLLQDKAYRKAMGEAARLSAEVFSTSSNIADAWSRLFRELELGFQPSRRDLKEKSLARINFEIVLSNASTGMENFRKRFVAVGKLRAAQEERDALLKACSQLVEGIRRELDGHIPQSNLNSILQKVDELIREDKVLHKALRQEEKRKFANSFFAGDGPGFDAAPLLLSILPTRLRSEQELRRQCKDGWKKVFIRRPLSIREWQTARRIHRWIEKKNIGLDEAHFVDLILATLPQKLRSTEAISRAAKGDPSWRSALLRSPFNVHYWQALRQIQRVRKRKKRDV